MSIVVTFDEDFLYELNDSSHENVTSDISDHTSPCEPKLLDGAVGVTICLLLTAIFLLAIPGNVLVGWVIRTSQHALTPSDVYLFQLTLADGLMALTIPFWAVVVIRGWLFGDFMCKVLSLIFDINFYTSILFLACISIDRYLVIVHAGDSLKSRQRMCSQLVCAGVWALGCALALPALFNDVTRPKNDSDWMTCNDNFDIGNASKWRLAIRGFRHIFGFLLPLGVMVTCYSITIARLLRTRGFQKHRAMRVIIIVVIVFFLCWLPYHLSMIVDTLLRAGLIPYDCARRTSVSTALGITNSLALLHSCINPFLYAFVGEKFRRKMKMLLQRKMAQERMSVSKYSRSTSQTSEGNGTVL
ncbi:C-X-C chemokine receptor type 2-like [Eucyclogobius newberryi]|uniref:C-X-C chemokine receptor type 2-like n=1 Tax=Eucyclogobius newberryi TaxID=166745 RepID=UPI003B59DD5F